MSRFAPGGSSSRFGLGAKTPAASTPAPAATTVAAAAIAMRSQVDPIAGLRV
jgi:hypothetical protein